MEIEKSIISVVTIAGAAFFLLSLGGCSNYPAGVYNSVPGKHDQAWNSPDKVGHAAAGAVIGAVTSLVAIAAGADPQDAVKIGCGTAVVAGIGKEVYDYHWPSAQGRKYAPGEGYWEMADAVATGGAGCIPALVMRF